MLEINKTKGKKYRHMIQGLLGILDGLIRLLSFGNFWTNFQFRYVVKNLDKK